MEGRIKRGDIWTITPPKHPKPRPVVIVSINALNNAEWPDVVAIPITTVPGPLRGPIPERVFARPAMPSARLWVRWRKHN